MDIGYLEHIPAGEKRYQLNDEYDADFYRRCIEMHDEVVPLIAQAIYGIFKPVSVLDLGCGAGMWLRAFQRCGVREIFGVDGSDASQQHRAGDLAQVINQHDLRRPFLPSRRYDLCLILDVIEHIEPEFEDNVIESCINCSDTIIFSSPPPGQGGDGHVNERPMSHWVRKFFERGYIFRDNIRPIFEGMRHIPETTYQLNIYTLQKAFEPAVIPELKRSIPDLLPLLSEKETRIEDLFLQTLFAGKELESLRRQLQQSQAAQIVEVDHSAEWFNGLGFTTFEIPSALINHESGHCYVYQFKSSAMKLFGRLMKNRTLVLNENGAALVHGDQYHDDIRKLGGGRFSIWDNQLYFSTSDGSDPRANGRTYSFEVPSFVHFVENMPVGGIERFGL